MAAPTTATPPLPAPPSPSEPPRDVVAESNKKIAEVKTKNDWLRPLKYAFKFTAGTIGSSLDNLAKYGRKGVYVGAGIGIIMAIATGGLAPLVYGVLLGLAIGGGGGALYGAVTGGMNAVGREHRATVYAEDLVQRKKVQTEAAPNLHDYRAAYRARQQQRSAANTQQVLERTNENTRDYNTYWRDKVDNEKPERGLGF